MATNPYEPAHFDWHVRGGDCLTLMIRMMDSAREIYDLTGYEARATLTWRNNSLVLSSEDSPARVTVGATTGLVTVEITGEETDALPKGKTTQHEIVLIEPDGCEHTPLVGYIVRH